VARSLPDGGLPRTALWTAACRADEMLRHDPLVVDPFAEELCGEEGLSLGRALEHEGRAHDAIVVRTRMIDEKIVEAYDDGHRTILVLGAGLDARPYRLALGSDVRWIEVDLPEMIAWKRQRLAKRASEPRVERHALDLRDPAALAKVLRSIDRGPLLVVLEGVLAYLAPEEARTLLRTFAARSDTRVVCDVGGGTWARLLARRPGATAARAGAPYRLQIGNARRFFSALGFEVSSDTSLVDWDRASPRPRFAHGRELPWVLRLVPGLRDVSRVIAAHAR